MKKIMKITVNTGQVMFNGELYYYWPLNSVDKIVGKNIFCLCIIYCVTNAVAVIYSRNIPMAEMRIVRFQSKNKNMYVLLFLTNMIYIWRDILKYMYLWQIIFYYILEVSCINTIYGINTHTDTGRQWTRMNKSTCIHEWRCD